jgi:hypothetical protein
MGPRLGKVVLGLSAAGFPLTQLAIRRFGRRGAVVTESVCIGLAIRDAAMIAGGAPSRLRRGPARLLWLEMVAALAAAGLGRRLARDDEAAQRVASCPDTWEAARRGAVALLFGLHTVRFRIYLQPDRGRKPAGLGHRTANAPA